MNLKVIAFDADDTLWVNEPYFQETEQKFCALLEHLLPRQELAQELLKIQVENLPLYGYGAKGFVLSMIETALKVTDNTISSEAIGKIVGFGRGILNQPVVLLDNVTEVLTALQGHYKLVVATKGDLLDQERKLRKSNISHFFHHIEIMSDKKDADYLKLIKHLDIEPSEFMMVGNSLRSDILPVLRIGGNAIHIPYHVTWVHEQAEINLDHDHFKHHHGLIDILADLMPITR